MAKSKKQDAATDGERPEEKVEKTWRRNNVPCLCLSGIPGHPYRIGYAKVYVDGDNVTRCVYCTCLAPDPRKSLVPKP